MPSDLRHDPLADRWIVVSPGRGKRPHDSKPNEARAQLVEAKDCRFCHGNENQTPPEIFAIMKDGSTRKDYRGNDFNNWLVRVVPNKFAYLSLEPKRKKLGRKGVGIYDQMDGYGAHEVIIETPGPGHMEISDAESPEDIFRAELLLRSFKERIRDLTTDKSLKFCLIFKNYKPDAGASIEHPHCQLNATPVTLSEPGRELRMSKAHFAEKERCLLCDIINFELESGKRLVLETENFVVFCPFASRFPAEMLIAPKPDAHLHHFHAIADALIPELAGTLINSLKKLKNVFGSPYNLGLHSAPMGFNSKNNGETIEDDYHWHLHVHPRHNKLAGFEIEGGVYVIDIAPETAAEQLRDA